jgi:hypothetical protein
MLSVKKIMYPAVVISLIFSLNLQGPVHVNEIFNLCSASITISVLSNVLILVIKKIKLNTYKN